jgi:hypothetical protein
VIEKRSRGQELEEAENEIRALGMESYYSMLRFNDLNRNNNKKFRHIGIFASEGCRL